MHRFQHTLDLLAQTIAKAPNFFPADRRAAMDAELRTLRGNAAATRDEIESRIVSFGREIWPYRKAFYLIHDAEGRPRELDFMRGMLEPDVKAKLDAYLRGGGRFDDIRRGGEFEAFFTPEEKQAIVEAKLEAHGQVLKEIEELCAGEKRAACDLHVGDFKKQQEEIARMIEALRKTGSSAGKWQGEIMDKVHTFELGWGGIEHDVRAEDVRGEIEYYEGVIAATTEIEGVAEERRS